MAIKDWITFPRTGDGWHTRANAWMNELKDCVTTNVTNIAANTANIAAIGTAEAFTPVWTNVTMSSTTGVKVVDGDRVYFFAEGVISVIPTGFVVVDLPELPHATMVEHEVGSIVWLGEDVTNGDTYTGFGFTGGAGNLSARIGSSAGAAGAWQVATPFVWAVGDLITVSGTYVKA